MYEELYAPLPAVQPYLERIGYAGNTVTTPEELNALIEAHLQTVPFENLDVLNGTQPPSLGIPALYDKIVTRRRGGYCFELNALLYALLQALNIPVTPAATRIVWKKNFLPPYAHRANVAKLDGGYWFCDVGYGGPCPVGILRLDSREEQVVRNARFRCEETPSDWVINRFHDGSFLPMLRLTKAPAEPVDFTLPNFMQAMNPASYFKSKTIVSVHTETGMRCIDGTSFRETANGAIVREESIPDNARLQALLQAEFGIVLS